MSDVIDTRDLQDEIDELESELEDQPADEKDEVAVERLAALLALKDEIGSEWEDGVALVADGYFEDYAREMAEDCGMVGDGNKMSDYVDWERWASDVQTDYSSVEFDDETYWYR